MSTVLATKPVGVELNLFAHLFSYPVLTYVPPFVCTLGLHLAFKIEMKPLYLFAYHFQIYFPPAQIQIVHLERKESL